MIKHYLNFVEETCSKVSGVKITMTSFLVFLFFTNSSFSQLADHNIAVRATEFALNGNKCFDMEIINKENETIFLAGQNYRLYYDSDDAFFIENSLTSYLSEAYEDFNLKQHFFDIDASGFGILPFDANLGFINFGTDYKLHSASALELKPNVPVATAQICFSATDDIQLTWAQANFTSTYATAFVEVSLYDGTNLLRGNIISHEILEDQTLNVQDERVANFESFPNPFTNEFKVDFNAPLPTDAILTLENIFGQLIRKESIGKGQSSITLDGKGLESGAYFLSIVQDQDIRSTIKIVKLD